MLRLLVPLLVAGLFACSSPSDGSDPTPAPSPTPDASIPDEWRSCAAPTDCVLVARVCCDCMAADYVAVRSEHRAAASDRVRPDCEDRTCPAMDCPPIDPFCVDALCAAGERGYPPKSKGRVVGGYFVTDEAPDPVACAADADCIGNTLLGADGCCRDPLTLLPHSKAYDAWQGARQSGPECADVTCPPPPDAGEPADCYFDVRCVEGACRNSCGGG